LRLFGGALYFLRRSVGLLGSIEQLLKLRFQLLHLLALLFHLLLLCRQGIAEFLFVREKRQFPVWYWN